ncbi:MAG TPA: hypothetical protein VMB03_17400 [Bryobacteraceae bacterium]|nr:hypothetical protein [Bryobacteraceae bacterium]
MTYASAVTMVLVVVLAIVAVDIVLRLVFRGPKAVPARAPGLAGWLRIAVNAAGFAALVAAAITGFSPALSGNGQMTGDALITHVTMAPPFAVLAVIVALFWAHRNRFSDGDWGRLASAGYRAGPLRKFFFWIAVAAAVPAMVSILAAMFPLFDTEGQENLIRIHRYCGLFLAGSGVLFAYFAWMAWREGSKD